MFRTNRSRNTSSASSFEEQQTELLPVIEQGPREFSFFDDQSSEPFAETHREPRQHRDVSFRGSEPRRGSSGARGGRAKMQRLIGLGVVAAVIAVAALGWSLSAAHSSATGASAQSGVAAKAAAAKSKKKKPKHKRSTTSHKTASASANSSAKVAAAAKFASAKKVASAASTKTTAAASRSLASLSRGDVVVIDAGHQGHGDSGLEPIGPGSSTEKPKVADGASGQYAPHDESQVNLDVALKLRTTLAARGVKVVMVRTSQNVNISNSQRAAIANKAHAALFIRLHCDGISDSSRHGFSTLIPAKNQWTGPIMSASAKAGRIVQHDALAATGASDAGVVQRSDLSGFNWSKVPTVLVEMGFMSNRAEDKALTTSSYQQKLANGLANGVVDYLKSR